MAKKTKKSERFKADVFEALSFDQEAEMHAQHTPEADVFSQNAGETGLLPRSAQDGLPDHHPVQTTEADQKCTISSIYEDTLRVKLNAIESIRADLTAEHIAVPGIVVAGAQSAQGLIQDLGALPTLRDWLHIK